MSALSSAMAGLMPVGCVLPYAGPLAATDTTQSNLDEIRYQLARRGWLYCDGAAYACQDYPELHGVIGNAYGGDDQTFNVPDLRGRFMRGVNGDAPPESGDPCAAQRTASGPGNTGNSGNRVGSLQRDAYQGHEHNYSDPQVQISAQPGGPDVYMQPLATQATSGQVQDSSIPGNGPPRADVETRPINLYFNYIIRYR